MSLLTSMLLFLIVGCGEWYLALRRTLACARGEKVILVSIVFIENLLGLWVLSNFVRTNNWLLALSYASGASAGALIVVMNSEKAKTATEAVKALDRAAAAPVADDSPIVPAVRRQPGSRRLSFRAIRPRHYNGRTSPKLISAAASQPGSFTPRRSEGAGPAREPPCVRHFSASGLIVRD